MAQQDHSGTTLLLAIGGALLAGCGLGYLVARRALKRSAARSDGPSAPFLNLSHLRSHSTEPGYSSGLETPCDTPRTMSSDSLAGVVAAGMNVKMTVLVRQDIAMSANKIICSSCWTVLGMFKKLYKRRDPVLKIWDVTGERLDVLLVPSEDEMMSVQANARAVGLPTHTFAGRDRRRKQRTVMAVGPADADTLRQVVGHLKEL